MKTKYLALRNIAEMHLEVSNGCNLECIYCFAHQKKLSTNSLMPLKIACKYIDIIFENTCSEDIDIVFHGGEPLLQSTIWFHNVIEYAIRLSKIYNKKLRFMMQSNCTLLDDEKLDLIKEYHIIVGSSLDGPLQINNLSRKQGDLVIKNIQKLKTAECFGGVICVINRHNYNKMKEVMEFFEDEGISATSAIVGYSVGRGESLQPLSSDMIFLAYKGIFDYLEETGGNRTVEGNMAARLSRYVSPPRLQDFKEILICSHPFCGGGITTIMCTTEGDLYPCGCSICNPQTLLENLNSFSSERFIYLVKKFHEKENKYFEECTNCDAARICRFGCPTFSSIDVETTNSECQANKQFYSFLNQKENSTIKEIIKNLRRAEYGAKPVNEHNDNKCLSK